MHHGNGTRSKIRCGWLASAQQEGGTKAAAEGAFRIGVRNVKTCQEIVNGPIPLGDKCHHIVNIKTCQEIVNGPIPLGVVPHRQ